MTSVKTKTSYYSSLVALCAHPQFFIGERGGFDTESVHDLFDFKNYVIKIIS